MQCLHWEPLSNSDAPPVSPSRLQPATIVVEPAEAAEVVRKRAGSDAAVGAPPRKPKTPTGVAQGMGTPLPALQHCTESTGPLSPRAMSPTSPRSYDPTAQAVCSPRRQATTRVVSPQSQFLQLSDASPVRMPPISTAACGEERQLHASSAMPAPGQKSPVMPDGAARNRGEGAQRFPLARAKAVAAAGAEPQSPALRVTKQSARSRMNAGQITAAKRIAKYLDGAASSSSSRIDVEELHELLRLMNPRITLPDTNRLCHDVGTHCGGPGSSHVTMDEFLQIVEENGWDLLGCPDDSPGRHGRQGTPRCPSLAAPSGGCQRPATAPSTQDFEWEIPLKDIELATKIGEGSFGVVYKGKWQGCIVAVKG
eukprot:m51a1_g9996 hypothetical protein (368) ;mRNA; f:58504-59739